MNEPVKGVQVWVEYEEVEEGSVPGFLPERGIGFGEWVGMKRGRGEEDEVAGERKRRRVREAAPIRKRRLWELVITEEQYLTLRSGRKRRVQDRELRREYFYERESVDRYLTTRTCLTEEDVRPGVAWREIRFEWVGEMCTARLELKELEEVRRGRGSARCLEVVRTLEPWDPECKEESEDEGEDDEEEVEEVKREEESEDEEEEEEEEQQQPLDLRRTYDGLIQQLWDQVRNQILQQPQPQVYVQPAPIYIPIPMPYAHPGYNIHIHYGHPGY